MSCDEYGHALPKSHFNKEVVDSGAVISLSDYGIQVCLLQKVIKKLFLFLYSVEIHMQDLCYFLVKYF